MVNANPAQSTNWRAIGLLILVVLGFIYLPDYLRGNKGEAGTAQQTSTPLPTTPPLTKATGLNCGSDKAADLGVRYRNTLDTTQEEYMALSVRIIGHSKEGKLSYLSALTTNSGTGSSIAYATDTANVACGEIYTLAFISDTDANGNVKPLAGDSYEVTGAQIISKVDGQLTVQLTDKITRINARGREHSGELETRIFDEKNNAFMFSNTTTSATTFETDDPANFTSTTDNATATTVAANDYIERSTQVKPQTSYEERNDFGTWILFDMGSSSPRSNWKDLQTIKVNGVLYNEAKGTMNEWEAKRYADYEYAFFIPSSVSLTRDDYWTIYRFQESLSNNPSERILMRIATRGQFAKTDGTIAVSAADDTSNNAAVLDEHDIYETIT